ncbi:MAG: CotH kinase family protein, partial [Chitinophagaceae bacterium]
MKTILYALCVMALFCTACNKDQDVSLSGDHELLTFSFQPDTNSELVATDLVCDISDSVVSGAQGTANNARGALVATFTTSGVVVLVNGVPQVSGETVNDFSGPVTYTVIARNGSSRDYAVKLKAFTGIPILYITTESPVDSKDVYVNGSLKVDGNMEFSEGLYDGAIQIKGRGNSTWFQPKKPYKIKLASKSKLLGMSSDKEWVLLANYLDKSLLRNKVGFELGKRFNMTYTPKSRFVEVFLNGSYLGNYLLLENIKVSSERLNINQMDVANPNDSLGGFLTQVDARLDGTTWFTSYRDVPFVMQTPDVLPERNLQYIKNFINKIEAKIYSYQFNPVTGYAADLDIDKFVDWYLINEVMATNDACFYSSVYMFRDRGGKLTMGPLWDFDLSSGNVNYGHVNPEGWALNTSAWMFMLVRDP